MCKTVFSLTCFICFLFAPQRGFAFTIGSTNFDFLGYPKHKCNQPYIPHGRDKYAWEMFKISLDEYTECIRLYVEAAKNDQERIAEEANKAVDEHNAFVNSIR